MFQCFFYAFSLNIHYCTIVLCLDNIVSPLKLMPNFAAPIKTNTLAGVIHHYSKYYETTSNVSPVVALRLMDECINNKSQDQLVVWHSGDR